MQSPATPVRTNQDERIVAETFPTVRPRRGESRRAVAGLRTLHRERGAPAYGSTSRLGS